MMKSFRGFLRSLDAGVYRCEKALVGLCLSMMTFLIFIDVMQRTFSRPVGKMAKFLLWVISEPVESDLGQSIANTVGPASFWVLAWLFAIGAVQSARHMRAQRGHAEELVDFNFMPSVVWGTFFWACFFGFLKALLWFFPVGVPGAQKFALGFMMWAGFLGATMATHTRRHIVVDAVKKKLDPLMSCIFSGLGGVASASLAGYLAFLGYLQLHEEYVDWATGEGVGVFEALPIPIWVVTLALPVTFGIIAIRFFVMGMADMWYGPPEQSTTDLLGMDDYDLPDADAQEDLS
jgi:TRAP-type C4-dicarboxylate transport system permease small subunit